MTDSKRYLLAFWDGGGLVPPLLGVARRLIARGHQVHVLADPTVEAEARAAGCSFGPWRTAPHRTSREREHDLLRDYDYGNPMKYFKVALREFFGDPGPRWVADTLDEIRRHPVDAVLCDALVPWPILAARTLGLPCAALSPNVMLTPTPGLTPAGMGLRPARGMLGRMRDAILRRLMSRTFNGALPVLNEVRRNHGLPALASFDAQLWEADAILVLTSAAFDFPASKPIPKLHWVGPQLDDPSWSDKPVLPWAADDDRPLVLVGLGSTFQKQVGTLRNTVAALATLPVRGLVTLGPAIRPDEVAGADNVVVVPSAPHAALLPQTAVLVTHGGHGTTIKGAAAGVPMLCIPLGRDQADNAVRVTTRGAGLRVDANASVGVIRGAIERLLNESSFREAASALAAAIHARQGDDDAVALLESLARRPAAPAPSTYAAADPLGPIVTAH